MAHLFTDLALSRFEVDRAGHLRSDVDWLKKISADSLRILVVNNGSIPVTDDASLVWLHAEAVELTEGNTYLLGATDEHTFVALDTGNVELDDVIWTSLRDIGFELSAHDVGLATSATALASWHRTHAFCNRCGQRTSVVQAGWARHCPTDDIDLFPRTEPAIITAIEDRAGRILLGRRREWSDGWYSTLAGFVDAGESAEAALVREVKEESGIDIDPQSIRYLGSQPWPFPASLMLAYRATALHEDVVVEEAEMGDVRWFSRDEFTAACSDGSLRLPTPVSVAWRLIEDWYGERMPLTWSRTTKG